MGSGLAGYTTRTLAAQAQAEQAAKQLAATQNTRLQAPPGGGYQGAAPPGGQPMRGPTTSLNNLQGPAMMLGSGNGGYNYTPNRFSGQAPPMPAGPRVPQGAPMPQGQKMPMPMGPGAGGPYMPGGQQQQMQPSAPAPNMQAGGPGGPMGPGSVPSPQLISALRGASRG